MLSRRGLFGLVFGGLVSKPLAELLPPPDTPVVGGPSDTITFDDIWAAIEHFQNMRTNAMEYWDGEELL